MQTSDGLVRQQARSIRNDALILDASVRAAAEVGWSGLLPARVAEAAGLSRSTVSDRLRTRSAVGAWVWSERLAPVMGTAVQHVLELIPAGVQSGDSARPVTPRELARVMAPFVEPDEAMRAAGELLVVGTFDEEVHQAVRSTLGALLDDELTPAPRRLTKSNAARRAFLVIVALGVLLETRRHDATRPRLHGEWARICSALEAPEVIRKIPEVHFEHWDGVFDFDTGDSLLDRLLEATRDEVGRKGYDATTVESIARRAGRTKGLVFSRYPNKKDLFIDTLARYTKSMFDLNEKAFAKMRRHMSTGAAEAALYREYMRPGREHLHVFALEQHRLSWHDAEMREGIAASMADAITVRMEAHASMSREQWEAFIFIGAAQGVGTMLLASCCPDAWTLPFHVMTVPLND